VRTLKIVVALLLAVAGPAGCGLLGDDPGQREDEQIQRILDEEASFTVLLSTDATEAQRKDVEAALRALPGFTDITYSDQEATYRRMKQFFSAQPSLMEQLEPENLPASFEVGMTDIAAVRKVRDNESTVRDLPGVEDVTFPCTTVRECRETHSPRPTASPS
jgi:cell division transport system permease protein